MSYKHGVSKNPIIGKNWTLSFGLNESTGGVNAEGISVNFTCASACMWNVNFTRNVDKYNMYGHDGPSLVPVEERYELYDQLVKRYVDNTFMVQLVGVVNGATAARKKHYLNSENKHGYHTSDFANYLITKQVGVVVESPVFVNTYHAWDGPSICQAWFWFSPSIVAQGALLKDSGAIHGLGNVSKFLHESDIRKTNSIQFKDLLNPVLSSERRLNRAANTWDKSLAPTPEKVPEILKKKVPNYGELWTKKAV